LQQKAVAHDCDVRWLSVRLLERDTLAQTIIGTRISINCEVKYKLRSILEASRILMIKSASLAAT
jgi:ABC-type microcin C transport system permease subunit YejE